MSKQWERVEYFSPTEFYVWIGELQTIASMQVVNCDVVNVEVLLTVVGRGVVSWS